MRSTIERVLLKIEESDTSRLLPSCRRLRASSVEIITQNSKLHYKNYFMYGVFFIFGVYLFSRQTIDQLIVALPLV